ncbi:MAG: sugar phosphate isomerase/epimerase [Euryarchaeota archaeon]|nr:sugar phosphate isomerase/epimerase [Euryarchaeota archaeon]
MKVGFTALALFDVPFETALQVAKRDSFDAIELLCEGPYLPRFALKNLKQFESATSYDFDITLHAPTVDLNPASVNVGIREETARQLQETIDFAVALDASTITTHPGYVKRINDRVTARALTFALATLREWAECSSTVGVTPSIENMPNNPKYFCTSVLEHELFVDRCASSGTIDVGHAHTCGMVAEFMRADFPVSYYHVSDNHGIRDEHLAVGDGTIDWALLRGMRKAIIEINDYEAIKMSRDKLLSMQGTQKSGHNEED